MKVTTTIKQFGQTMEVEMEVSRLSYKQLQAYIKEAKEQGFTGIKLNTSKEALQAEVEAIEVSKAKAKEVIDPEVELAEEYRMDGCQPLDYPVVTATAEELEALEVAYQAPESDWIEPKSEPVVDLDNADEVVANFEHGVSYHRIDCGLTLRSPAPACSLASKPKVEIEPYTEAMAAEDDELTAGVVVDEGSQYDGVDILAVNYRYNDTENSIHELNWVNNSCKVGIHTSNRYGEAYNAPACSLVYCDATNRAFGHDPEAVAEVRVVGGYSYYEGFIRRTATVTATMLTCDVCNYQQCDLPEPYDYYEVDSLNGKFKLEDDANYLVRVWYCDLPQPYIHPELGLVNGSSLTTTTVDLSNLTDRDYGYENADTLVANITYYAGDDAGKPTFHHYDQRNPLDLLRGGLHYDNHTFGFSQVYGAACSVYPEVTSEGVLKIVPEGQPKTCSTSDRPCPCGRMTINDCAGECDVTEPVDTIVLSEDEFKQVCEEHGFTCDDSSMIWADVKKALLQDDDFKAAYDVTPDLRKAFKDTTAHYRVTHREPLLVAAINNTYGFLTSELVTKTIRSAWFWSYASLCVLWVMVQLTWQGVKLAARLTYKAYKLATSPKAIALYDLVITQTLTILCNLTDYADDRWRLLWGFLDAGIELATGLLPKRQPDLVKVQYFLD